MFTTAIIYDVKWLEFTSTIIAFTHLSYIGSNVTYNIIKRFDYFNSIVLFKHYVIMTNTIIFAISSTTTFFIHHRVFDNHVYIKIYDTLLYIIIPLLFIYIISCIVIVYTYITRRSNIWEQIKQLEKITKNETIESLVKYWAKFEEDNIESEIDVENNEILLDLLLLKREFAYMIKTDFKVLKWVMEYIAVFVYPVVGIFIANIWNYQDSFSSGIDLFKTYIIAASFIMSSLLTRIQFVMYMIIHRPFNIGDIIIMKNGETYKVKNVSPGHTSLLGDTTMFIENNKLDEIKNITKTNNNADSIKIKLPIKFKHTAFNDAKNVLHEYALNNPREIDITTIRCGWDTIDNTCKVLQCSWKYNNKIYNRTKLGDSRNEIVKLLIELFENEATLTAYQYNAAAGGAYNKIIEFVDIV